MSWKTNYYEIQPGAAPEALAKLRAAAPVRLPESYYELLSFSNGGHWPVGAPGQFSFDLSPAEAATETCQWEPRKPSAASNFLDGFVLIGVNGCGVCIGFDIRGPEPWPVVEVDRHAEPDERVILVATDFDAFLEMLGMDTW